jgi:hypothetical protein
VKEREIFGGTVSRKVSSVEVMEERGMEIGVIVSF